MAGTAVLVERSPAAYAWLALPLTLMGVSQGLTISPNQTLTLNAVDPRFGGVAGGVLQLGQRIGTAVGTAVVPGALFAVVESGRSWLDGFLVALALIAACAALALVVCVRDRAREKAEAAAA
ncbi:hypothetical protein GCM10027418_09180 [Mariniluteicoccus endophyticus]